MSVKFDPHEIEDLQFFRYAPKYAVSDPSAWAEINDLRENYYSSVFPDRSNEERARFLSRLTLPKWMYPNRAVGNTSTEGQRYIRPRVVVAVAPSQQDRQIVGYAYGAQNVSSTHTEPVATLERAAKLLIPVGKLGKFKFRDAKYVTIKEVVTKPGLPSLTPLMVDLLLRNYNPQQPTSCYPYAEETDLPSNLSDWGYSMGNEGPSPEPAFGPDAPVAQQERWTNAHIKDVLHTMHENTALKSMADRVEFYLP